MNCKDCMSEILEKSKKCKYCGSYQGSFNRLLHGFLFRSLIIVIPICVATVWITYIENEETSKYSRSLLSEEQKDSIGFEIGSFDIVKNQCDKKGIHGNLIIINSLNISLDNAEIYLKLMNNRKTEFTFIYEFYKTIPANSEIEISVEQELKIKDQFEFDSIYVDLIRAHKFPM